MSEQYKVVATLGEGAFGKCFLVQTASSFQHRVIKQIDLNPLSSFERNEALREAKILEKLHHPNIIRFYEVYRTRKNKLCIVMEYADDKDLAAKLESQHQSLPEPLILDYFVQICLGLKHVHDKNIIHRDLKSHNIFLTKAGEVKLGDFGIAKTMTQSKDLARSIVGTPQYLSPEIVQNQPYSFKSDVWALGVLLYQMCALRLPFQGTSIHSLATAILRGKYTPLPQSYSQPLRDLVTSLLTQDPISRPSVTEVLANPILADRIGKYLDTDAYHLQFRHVSFEQSDSYFTSNSGLETSIDSSFQGTHLRPSLTESVCEKPTEISATSDHSDHLSPKAFQEECRSALRRIELKSQESNSEEATVVVPPSEKLSSEPSAETPPQSGDQFFRNAERAEAMRLFLEEEMGANLIPAYNIIKEIEDKEGSPPIQTYYSHLQHILKPGDLEQRVVQILVLLELEK